MATIKEKLARVDADRKANQERAKAFVAAKRTYPIGVCIQLSVMIPSLKKSGKGVVITRADETTVMVDPTDVDTMITVLRGSLANSQLTLPMDILCADDNEMFEVDLECPKCKQEREGRKPNKARERRLQAKEKVLRAKMPAAVVKDMGPEGLREAAEIHVKKDEQRRRDELSGRRQKSGKRGR